MSLAHRSVYPTQSDPLRRHLDALLDGEAPELDGEVVGLVVPDSNRQAGGEAAASAYRLLRGQEIDVAVVVSPSHSGAFGRLSICQTDAYRTPLGEVAIDDPLRHELCDEDDDIFLDDTGHYHTEGADVQLPFLQRVVGDGFRAVPIVMGEEGPAFCRELGAAIGEVLYGKNAVVIGSADLLAAEPEALARFRAALDALDEGELLHLMGSEAVRVEGMGAIVTTLIAARKRGATAAHVLALTEPDPAEDGAPGALAVAFVRA